jgi:hypothetical protein
MYDFLTIYASLLLMSHRCPNNYVPLDSSPPSHSFSIPLILHSLLLLSHLHLLLFPLESLINYFLRSHFHISYFFLSMYVIFLLFLLPFILCLLQIFCSPSSCYFFHCHELIFLSLFLLIFPFFCRTFHFFPACFLFSTRFLTFLSSLYIQFFSFSIHSFSLF